MNGYGSGKAELGGSDRIVIKDEYGLIIYGRRWLEQSIEGDSTIKVHLISGLWLETMLAYLRVHFPEAERLQYPITDEDLEAISYEFVLRLADVKEMESMQARFEQKPENQDEKC